MAELEDKEKMKNGTKKLPTPNDIFGIDPNFTGGIDSAEYIARMRGRGTCQNCGEPFEHSKNINCNDKRFIKPGLTKEEVKEVLFKNFLDFMKGQTISIIDGVTYYYEKDIYNFLATDTERFSD